LFRQACEILTLKPELLPRWLSEKQEWKERRCRYV
jgi:hypothetical protein